MSSPQSKSLITPSIANIDILEGDRKLTFLNSLSLLFLNHLLFLNLVHEVKVVVVDAHLHQVFELLLSTSAFQRETTITSAVHGFVKTNKRLDFVDELLYVLLAAKSIRLDSHFSPSSVNLMLKLFELFDTATEHQLISKFLSTHLIRQIEPETRLSMQRPRRCKSN